MASILKVDSMQGVTSAGDITITGEGTATMRLQQGVAKMWVAAETDAQPFDSFNTASGTDNGTGDYTYAFTNVMSNDDYSITSGCSYAAILSFDHPERTTSNYNVRIFTRADSLTNDNAKNNQAIHGDLA
jgi:hypothetical protein